MRVTRLELACFRNLEPLALEPGPRFNVVSGENGAGKSSLLEAVHYLGTLRSFRGAKNDDLIRTGAVSSRLVGTVAGDLSPRVLAVSLHRTEPRKVTLDGKRPRSSHAYAQALPVVVFHPGELALASGPSELRRTYLDEVLDRLDPTFGPVLLEYGKALRSRNRLLREGKADRRAIRVWDELLATRGAIVGVARRAVAAELAPRIEADFGVIIGEHVPLRVQYRAKVEPSEKALREALEGAYEKDVARGYTGVGPHADDVAIALRQVAARHHASQGQHRAMALAMKLAELEFLAAKLGRVPLLLLDDVSSELDRERTRRLFERIRGTGSQVFLTTTHPELIRLDAERVDFTVADGRIVGRR